MKEHKLFIDKTIILPIAMFSFMGLFISFLSKTHQIEFESPYLDLAISFTVVLQFITWMVVIVDIIRNPIHNKTMWYMGMIVMGPLTAILYLINREKHLRLFKRFKTI
jgi:hypothetical protein